MPSLVRLQLLCVDLAAQQAAVLVAVIQISLDPLQQLRAVVKVAEHGANVLLRCGIGFFELLARFGYSVQPTCSMLQCRLWFESLNLCGRVACRMQH